MAEFVELEQEMSLAQYNLMKKIKIFEPEEIQKIKKTRENFEYKIQRQRKVLKDYCEYIKYERSLLTLISERKITKKSKLKKDLERMVVSKIMGLYKKTLSRFQGEIRLWESFVNFCKSYDKVGDIPEIIDRMLLVTNDKPDAWLKAVMWEFNYTKNMIRVKHLLTTALKHHPECKDLYKAFIQLELTEAEAINDSENFGAAEEKQVQIALKQCETIINSLIAQNDDIVFFIEILTIILQHSFAYDLGNHLLKHFKTFLDNPKVWDFFARSELEGVTVLSIESTDEFTLEITKGPRTLKTNIEKCVSVYEVAVSKLQSEEMWSSYIDTVLLLNEDMSTEPKLKRKVLGKALQDAHTARLLSEPHYIIYLRLFLEADVVCHEKVLDLFSTALKKYGETSTQLWHSRLLYGIKYESKEQVENLFQTAIKTLKDQTALELWQLMFTYYTTSGTDLNDEAIESFLLTAIKHKDQKIANHFKSEYIEWLSLTKGLPEARKTYRELTTGSSCSLALHQKMATLELTNHPVNVASARYCYELPTQFYGSDNVNVWLDYIKFERDHGNPKLVGNIYERAKKSLKQELDQEFIERYNLEMNKISFGSGTFAKF